ncbi:MAG: TfoX/Sxy family protein [Anaerolineae bacterium]|nr:TfoX/Sxy family protein [Anaerolineae bacterium]
MTHKNASSLENSLNLGPTSSQWLAEIGVHTRAELTEVGVVEAYCLVKARQPRASLNLLYALYGAVHNIPWNMIPPETKTALQEEVTAFRFGE